jgi:predicted ferric reductase
LSGNIGTEAHPFSISSASGENNIQIIIKSLGDFTDKLKNLQPGLAVSVEGPYGKFSHLNILNKNQVWLAGGVGITPFISMARSLKDDNYHIDLYYCVASREEAVLLSELKELESSKQIKVIPWYSLEQGHLNAKKIAELSPGLENKDILLCGPAPFMFGLKKQLLSLNIKRKNIHFENFKLL